MLFDPPVTWNTPVAVSNTVSRRRQMGHPLDRWLILLKPVIAHFKAALVLCRNPLTTMKARPEASRMRKSRRGGRGAEKTPRRGTAIRAPNRLSWDRTRGKLTVRGNFGG